MALTGFRWIAAVIIGCLITVVLILGEGSGVDRPDPGVVRQNLSERASAHYERARVAAGRIRLLDLRDSITAVASRAPATSGIRVFTDLALPREFRSNIDWLVRRSTKNVANAGVIPIDIAFVYDTAKTVAGMGVFRDRTSINYLLPMAPVDRCTVLYRVGHSENKETNRTNVVAMRSEISAERLLGPCAFYRAFGMPGPQIARWLDKRALDFAVEGSWDHPAFPISPDGRRWYPDSYWPTPALVTISPAGTSCAMGNVDQCEPVVLESLRLRAPLVWSGNITSVSVSATADRWYWYERVSGLGMMEPALLAAMVRTVGREKFTQFWISSEPVPIAFQNATGESLAAWTARWAGDAYILGPTGPQLPGWNAITSLLLVALGALIAVRVNSRRQFA